MQMCSEVIFWPQTYMFEGHSALVGPGCVALLGLGMGAETGISQLVNNPHHGP